MISMEAVITLQKKPVSWIMEAVINSSKLLVVCNHQVIADGNGFKYQFSRLFLEDTVSIEGGKTDKVRVTKFVPECTYFARFFPFINTVSQNLHFDDCLYSAKL